MALLTIRFLLLLPNSNLPTSPTLYSPQYSNITSIITPPYPPAREPSVIALAYYYPTNLLLSPRNWSPMVPVGFIWATGIGALKIAWCLGYGRATAGEMMTKRKLKD